MEIDLNPSYWRKCSSCKKQMDFNSVYFVCSVSTCNRQRTGLVFCSVACFDAHVPMMNHRDAGAFEKRAPSKEKWIEERKNEMGQISSAPKTSVASTPSAPKSQSTIGDHEILVVVSKVKEYIRTKSGGMNTSDGVADALSSWVRTWSNDAIRKAASSGRKTVMDRDID